MKTIGIWKQHDSANVAKCSHVQKFWLQLDQSMLSLAIMLFFTVQLVTKYNTVCNVSLTLNLSISGSTRSSGRPLTLTKPVPLLQCATAVAVFCNIVATNVQNRY